MRSPNVKCLVSPPTKSRELMLSSTSVYAPDCLSVRLYVGYLKKVNDKFEPNWVEMDLGPTKKQLNFGIISNTVMFEKY